MLTNSSFNQNTSQLLLKYCKDINEWPNRWAVEYDDIEIGRAINEYFQSFLLDRIEKKRTKSTIKIYARYLQVLGEVLIRCVSNDNDVKNLSSKDLIVRFVDHSGGPHWHHARDGFEHARYDSVCKQLFRFINDDFYSSTEF